jgi:hypothetical protein
MLHVSSRPDCNIRNTRSAHVNGHRCPLYIYSARYRYYTSQSDSVNRRRRPPFMYSARSNIYTLACLYYIETSVGSCHFFATTLVVADCHSPTDFSMDLYPWLHTSKVDHSVNAMAQTIHQHCRKTTPKMDSCTRKAAKKDKGKTGNAMVLQTIVNVAKNDNDSNRAQRTTLRTEKKALAALDKKRSAANINAAKNTAKIKKKAGKETRSRRTYQHANVPTLLLYPG